MMLQDKVIELIKEKNTRKDENLDRDIKIILTYFGFGLLSYPTYELIAEEFKIGTRQRVEQIISNKFIKKIKSEDIDVALKIQMVIEKKDIHFVSELNKSLIEEGLVDKDINIYGIFNLLNCFNLCNDYAIYSYNLKRATKHDIEFCEDLLIVKNETANVLLKEIKIIKTLPGQHGICNLLEVYNKMETRCIKFEELKRIISLYPLSWTYFDNDKNFWYMFEDRDNIIINTLEKIQNVTSNIHTYKLSEIIYNTIHKRTLKYSIPTSSLIYKYLLNSKFTSINNDYVTFKLERSALTQIENDIYELYKIENTENLPYNFLNKQLSKKGYTKVYLDKSLMHSPFIYVDKRLGRGKYNYLLVSKFSNIDIENGELLPSDYEQYKARLKNLYGETDTCISSRIRREQNILKEWLFKNNNYEECAICGKSFSISSLVTAHKKKRCTCSESERTDPNIVMPLCLFGCDHLYEKESIRINNGEVKIVISESMSESEINYLKGIEGRRVDSKWIQGNTDYFL